MARKDLQNLKKRLHKVSFAKSANPDPEWKYTFRQFLLIKTRTQTVARRYEQKLAEDLGFFGFVKSLQLKSSWVPSSVFAGILLAFFGSSVGTVLAAKASLPGEILFPVKLAFERTQLAIKDEPGEKTKLQIEITNRRAEELAKLVEENRNAAGQTEKIEQAFSELEYQLAAVKSELPRMEKRGNSENTVEVAKEATTKLAQVENVLNQMKGNVEKDLAQKIDSAAKLADSTSIEVLALIAKEAEKETSTVSKEEILDKVEQKIAKTEENIKAIEAKIKEIDTTKTSFSINASLVREQTDKAKEILNQAKESLKNENLTAALETMKMANEINSSAANLLTDMQKGENQETAVPAGASGGAETGEAGSDLQFSVE